MWLPAPLLGDPEDLLARHPRACLHFSGGKDSLAVLYALRAYWSRFDVVWVNTGEPLPETLELMAQVRAAHPRFRELRGEAPAWIEQNGLPSDVVPIWLTPFGRTVRPGRAGALQSTFECCAHNMWEPMVRDMVEQVYTLVIRGQREAEELRNPRAAHGCEAAGVSFWGPIEQWTEADVWAFLRENGVPVPAYYEALKVSVDCWGCTGYWEHQRGKLAWLRKTHPALAPVFEARVAQMRRLVGDAVKELAHG